MRILFMGTPEFSAVSLARLLEDGHDLCGVFTQPDKPKNRGHKITASPVKELAMSHGIPVFQLRTFRGEEGAAALKTIQSLAPELTVVAAYGKILPEAVLEAAPLGAINVHSSLLPKYRGAAPVNWAILNGETETGVSIMYLIKELDAGDVILQKRTPIGENEDAQSLTARLADLGAEALSEAVEAIRRGTAQRTPQDDSLSTYAPMLSRDMSEIDWHRTAREIHCQIRGLLPWPCACTSALNGETVKIFRAAAFFPAERNRDSMSGNPDKRWESAEARTRENMVPDADKAPDTDKAPNADMAPGTILAAEKEGIDVICGGGSVLRILELQSPGGKRMGVGPWLLGHHVTVGRQ